MVFLGLALLIVGVVEIALNKGDSGGTGLTCLIFGVLMLVAS